MIKSFSCFALTQLHCSSSSCRAAYRPAVVYEAVKSSSLVPRDLGILPAGWHTPQRCGHSAAKRHQPATTSLPGEADTGHCCSRTSVRQAHACCRTSFLGEKGALGPGDLASSQWVKFWSLVCFLPTTQWIQIDIFFLNIFVWVLKYWDQYISFNRTISKNPSSCCQADCFQMKDPEQASGWKWD